MAKHNAFEKRLRSASTFDRIEEALEQMGVPPAAVEWIRHHRKMVTIVLVSTIVTVVAYSLYDSHREKVVQRAASALSTATAIEDDSERMSALQKVAKKYSSTSSGLWAEVQIAQELAKAKKYNEANTKYSEFLKKIDVKNPLYGLLLYGRADALEGEKKYSEAITAYKELQAIIGYEAIGYKGEGRILEEQGKQNEAVAVYNNFIFSVADEVYFVDEKKELEARVARLQTVTEIVK